ncbi:MAG: hypothetical protein KDK39_05680 [Leptospiraceae bacterium]|nr:hypothetical protein [Leptospiraceae bacterium]
MGTFAACDKPNNTNDQEMMGGPDGLPAVQIEATVMPPNNLAFQINIPAGHHAYLNSGKENNFIPISFDWQALITKGILDAAPKSIQSPAGDLDTENQVHVLRGSVSYLFHSSANDKLKGESIAIESQLCNDQSGVCYRPAKQNITIE